jgi:hypothetical protein
MSSAVEQQGASTAQTAQQAARDIVEAGNSLSDINRGADNIRPRPSSFTHLPFRS